MNPPPFLDDWQTDWHLAAHVDQLPDRGDIDVVVAGTRLQIRNSRSGPSAHGGSRSYPVMVVDGEIFVLLSNAPA